MVSGTKTLAPDPLSPVDCKVESLWIKLVELVGPAHLIDVQLDWDLGNLEAGATP